jgi:hypothetical protein
MFPKITTPSLAHAGLGVVVSRKISKTARQVIGTGQAQWLHRFAENVWMKFLAAQIYMP